MKQLLLNVINSKSPESSRRLVILVLTLNFLAEGWYIFLKEIPLSNKELAVIIIQSTVVIIGSGWATISAEKFAKNKPNEPTDKPTE